MITRTTTLTSTWAQVRFFRVAEDGNSFKPHETVPELDFPKIFKDSKGGARPHGVVYKTFTTAV